MKTSSISKNQFFDENEFFTELLDINSQFAKIKEEIKPLRALHSDLITQNQRLVREYSKHSGKELNQIAGSIFQKGDTYYRVEKTYYKTEKGEATFYCCRPIDIVIISE